MKRTLTLAAAACALLFATASAQAIVLDLNDFIALPYAKVSINGTGTEANIVEDQSTDTRLIPLTQVALDVVFARPA
ncbi:MAG: hypothetical protein O3C34_18220, partial [Proteobacteria bacterium]|nr:hypothetical protein [Pseudomonadota bacterium]